MSNSLLLVVDSKDRTTNSNSTSDFSLNYSNNTTLTRIKSFFVKSFSCPNVEYNIHGTYSLEAANNLLYIETSGGGLQPVITITPGNYTIAQLITAITGSATGVAVGLGITQSATTGKLTFTATAPGGIKIYSVTSSPSSTLSPNLGVTTQTAAFSASIVADGLPFLAGNQNIYISSIKLSGGNSCLVDSRIGNLQVITTIPVDVAYGSYIHYETQQYEADMIEANGYFNLTNIDIKLYGDYGQLLDLQGLPCVLILKCYYDP